MCPMNGAIVAMFEQVRHASYHVRDDVHRGGRRNGEPVQQVFAPKCASLRPTYCIGTDNPSSYNDQHCPSLSPNHKPVNTQRANRVTLRIAVRWDRAGTVRDQLRLPSCFTHQQTMLKHC